MSGGGKCAIHHRRNCRHKTDGSPLKDDKGGEYEYGYYKGKCPKDFRRECRKNAEKVAFVVHFVNTKENMKKYPTHKERFAAAKKAWEDNHPMPAAAKPIATMITQAVTKPDDSKECQELLAKLGIKEGDTHAQVENKVLQVGDDAQKMRTLYSTCIQDRLKK
jgi:hypothetical protein